MTNRCSHLGKTGRRLCASLLLSACAFSTTTQAEELKVAYFPGWPTTHLIGQDKGWFDEALDMDVEFREFDTGAAMAAAMLSGDVQIAYSMGGDSLHHRRLSGRAPGDGRGGGDLLGERQLCGPRR